MKVKELIKALQAFDPELMVVVDGYEVGVGEPEMPVLRQVELYANEDRHHSLHELIYQGSREHPEAEVSAVVYLAR